MSNEQQFLDKIHEAVDRINVSTEELKDAISELRTEDSVVISYCELIRSMKHILYSVNYELEMDYIGLKAYLGSKDE